MRRGVTLVPVVLLVAAVVEIGVFVAVGSRVGFGWALLMVLAGSLLGVWLLRREGLRAWRGLRAAVAAGRPPGEQATDGLLGLGAALLLAVPGVVTSVTGLLLLVPPVRWWGRQRIRYAVERRLPVMVAGDVFGPRRARARWGGPVREADRRPDGPPQPASPGPAIEGEVVEPGQG